MSERNSSVHSCYFSALDDLPKRQHGDRVAVLRALAQAGRFSCFEVTDSIQLARTITTLCNEQATPKLIVWENIGFPWTKVTLTDAGRAVIAAAEAGDG